MAYASSSELRPSCLTTIAKLGYLACTPGLSQTGRLPYDQSKYQRDSLHVHEFTFSTLYPQTLRAKPALRAITFCRKRRPPRFAATFPTKPTKLVCYNLHTGCSSVKYKHKNSKELAFYKGHTNRAGDLKSRMLTLRQYINNDCCPRLITAPSALGAAAERAGCLHILSHNFVSRTGLPANTGDLQTAPETRASFDSFFIWALQERLKV